MEVAKQVKLELIVTLGGELTASLSRVDEKACSCYQACSRSRTERAVLFRQLSILISLVDSSIPVSGNMLFPGERNPYTACDIDSQNKRRGA